VLIRSIITRMSEQEQPIPWAGVIVVENGRLLALQEDDKSFLLVPGGKVEPGETDEAAAIREVREELGVAVDGLEPLTTIREESKSTGQQIRFRVFTGKLEQEPDPGNLPGKTVAIARIDSSYKQEGYEVGNLLKKLVPVLVEKGLIS